MNRQEVLDKIGSDINFIPSLEELNLIGPSNFSIGAEPIFKIILENKEDKCKIDKIEQANRDMRPDGLFELYTELSWYGHCESVLESRIYYVAYTLSKGHLIFNIEGFEYRNKLSEKSKLIQKLLNQLKR